MFGVIGELIQVPPSQTEQQFTIFNFSSKLKHMNQYLVAQLLSSLCSGKALQAGRLYGLVCIRCFPRICSKSGNWLLSKEPPHTVTHGRATQQQEARTSSAAHRSPGMLLAIPPPPPGTHLCCMVWMDSLNSTGIC